MEDHLDDLVCVEDQKEDKMEDGNHVGRKLEVCFCRHEKNEHELNAFVVKNDISQIPILVTGDVEYEAENDTNLDDQPEIFDDRVQHFMIIIWTLL